MRLCLKHERELCDDCAFYEVDKQLQEAAALLKESLAHARVDPTYEESLIIDDWALRVNKFLKDIGV